MYEDYLTKSLSSIIIAKQALNNYKITNIKDMKIRLHITPSRR